MQMAIVTKDNSRMIRNMVRVDTSMQVTLYILANFTMTRCMDKAL